MEVQAESTARGGTPGRARLRERLSAVLFVMVLAAIAAGVIAGVRRALAARIRVNENSFQQRKVLEALRLIPYADRRKEDTAEKVRETYRTRVRDLTGGGSPAPCYLALSEVGGKVDHVGVVVRWQGFWGPIEGVVTVSPADRRIWGMAVFSHSETPGLGARMTEPQFRQQFFSGKLRVPETARAETEGQRLSIDAITGATRTSESISSMLNRDLPRMVDALHSTDLGGPRMAVPEKTGGSR